MAGPDALPVARTGNGTQRGNIHTVYTVYADKLMVMHLLNCKNDQHESDDDDDDDIC